MWSCGIDSNSIGVGIMMLKGTVTCSILPQQAGEPVVVPSANYSFSITSVLNPADQSFLSEVNVGDGGYPLTVTFNPTSSDYFVIVAKIASLVFKYNITVMANPDQSSFLDCPENVFIGSSFSCTLSPNLNGFPCVAYSNKFTLGSSMISPRVRSTLYVGNFSSWDLSFGSRFVTTSEATIQTGTYQIVV